MKIHLIAAGTRMPSWVTDAYDDYEKRLPRGWLQLVEIPIAKRGRANVPKARDSEGKRMLAAVPARARVIRLEVDGQPWSTAQLATQLSGWMREGDDITLLIGGPDGLAPACRARAGESWSLSKLTLPHGLARVVVIEQVYRAWSILKGSPYHRD